MFEICLGMLWLPCLFEIGPGMLWLPGQWTEPVVELCMQTLLFQKNSWDFTLNFWHQSEKFPIFIHSLFVLMSRQDQSPDIIKVDHSILMTNSEAFTLPRNSSSLTFSGFLKYSLISFWFQRKALSEMLVLFKTAATSVKKIPVAHNMSHFNKASEFSRRYELSYVHSA